MAEVNAAEKEAKAEAAFGAGFGDAPPEVIPPAKVVEEAIAKPAKADAVAAVPVPEKPVYVRVTKQDWDNTKAATGKVASLESQLAKLTGSQPKAEQIIQQVMEKVQSQTPAGVNVEFSDEDFAELAEDFPELTKGMRTGLERLFKKANVRGTATASDPDAIDRAVDARLKARDEAAVAEIRQKEMSGLAEIYPDWGEIVGRPKVAGDEPVQTDWRKWATTNDPAALETDSPGTVQASIAKFKESQKAASASATPDRRAARRAVIEDAVTPRADGNPPPLNSPPSVEEAFASGFKTGKPH